MNDEEEEKERHKPYLDPDGMVYLPHQCDDWCIGKKEDVIEMIKLLQELVNEWDEDNK